MARGRRRKRERRDEREDRGTTVARRESRSIEKRRSEFVAAQRALARRRSVIGLLGFVPLAGFVGCGYGLTALCAIPSEVWLLGWAAFFGSFLGLTIRLFRERRKFERGAAGGATSS